MLILHSCVCLPCPFSYRLSFLNHTDQVSPKTQKEESLGRLFQLHFMAWLGSPDSMTTLSFWKHFSPKAKALTEKSVLICLLGSLLIFKDEWRSQNACTFSKQVWLYLEKDKLITLTVWQAGLNMGFEWILIRLEFWWPLQDWITEELQKLYSLYFNYVTWFRTNEICGKTLLYRVFFSEGAQNCHRDW